MKIVQSTWVRYHHFDLARELYKMGHLEHIFTCLPWWKAEKESIEQFIPREKISCNFLFQGIRRLVNKTPFYTKTLDSHLSVMETKFFSQWVAKNLPECDTYIGISGSGLHAGRLAKSRGSGYIMDRGSTHIRYANDLLREEYKRWNSPWISDNQWLIENEENEIEEATLITVPSDFVKQTFINQGVNTNKIRVVPYGVSLDDFFPTQLPLVDGFKLVFVGNFSIRKGAPYLLEAFKAFKFPKKELIVVGNISEEMLPIIKSIGDENIKFVGVVPRSMVKDYISTAHALVLPSIEEGLALVQAQAMACGCPVIATPNTGCENLFKNENEGLIVEVRSIEALTNAFYYLSEQREKRNEMSNACLEKVKELGGWKKYVEGMLDVAMEAKEIQQLKKTKYNHLGNLNKRYAF